ncbi:MAG: metal-dependent hydrolase [Vicinamibacterales bacterium]
MPSPLGHVLGGVIVGMVASRPSRLDRTDYRTLGLATLAACAPDVDFLWGRHDAESHSLVVAVVAGLLVLAVTAGRQIRPALAVTLAWSSHVLFDWLGSDTTPPIGVMALWPFTDAYFFANAYLFDAISRRYWLPGFWAHNILAVMREVVLLGPIVAVLVWVRRRR